MYIPYSVSVILYFSQMLDISFFSYILHSIVAYEYPKPNALGGIDRAFQSPLFTPPIAGFFVSD